MSTKGNYLETLKKRAKDKEEARDLISGTIKEICKTYTPGVLEWARAHKTKDIDKMKALELVIDETALNGNIPRLEEALRGYKGLIVDLVDEYSTKDEKTFI